MLYLLDASVLIRAKDAYYPLDQVPEFWEWLQHMGENNTIKIPVEIYEEIKDGPKDGEKDLLYAWIQEEKIKKSMLLDEEVDPAIVQRVVYEGYAADLNDDEIEQLGRDPFLLAYALASADDRCIVTIEVSRPGRTRQNRHIPDVCKSLGLSCCDPFVLNKRLGFKTGWKQNSGK